MCSRVGAVFLSHDFGTFADARFNWTFLSDAVVGCERNWSVFVKISGKPLWTGGLAVSIGRISIVIPNEERDPGFRLLQPKPRFLVAFAPRNDRSVGTSGGPETQQSTSLRMGCFMFYLRQVECPFPRNTIRGDAVARMARSVVLLIIAGFTTMALAQSGASAEQRTSRYFESIRRQPSLQLAFFRDMPKGGDLHVHLSGALYAENLIDYAASDNLCVDRTTSILIAPPCDDSCEKYASKPGIRCAYGDHVLYNSIVDAWSMRNWEPGEESGHDHFFATFDKFSLATHNHIGDSLAEAASRAAEDHLQYLELMHTADSVPVSYTHLTLPTSDLV